MYKKELRVGVVGLCADNDFAAEQLADAIEVMVDKNEYEDIALVYSLSDECWSRAVSEIAAEHGYDQVAFGCEEDLAEAHWIDQDELAELVLTDEDVESDPSEFLGYIHLLVCINDPMNEIKLAAQEDESVPVVETNLLHRN